MIVPNFKFISTLSLAAFFVLVLGLVIAVFSSQQQQDQRSKAHSSTPTLGTLPVVPGEQQQTVDIKIDCTTSGQLCEPVFKKIIQTGSVLKVNYTVGPLHCSPIKIHFLVDDVEKGVSDWLAWPDGIGALTSGAIDLGPVSSGDHTLGVKAEGKTDGCNEGRLGSWEGKVVIATSSAIQVPTATPTPLGSTKFDFDILFHGIGKAGDSKNKTGIGTLDPVTDPRKVFVSVYDLDDNVIIEKKEGEVMFDKVSGSYKGTVDMGTTLKTQAYTIRIKFTHSLWGEKPRSIEAGETNTIPQMILINGDANNDGTLSILDYDIIAGCVEDLEFNIPPTDCNPTKKLQGDIDDDGKNHLFDLTLFLREMSVQGL